MRHPRTLGLLFGLCANVLACPGFAEVTLPDEPARAPAPPAAPTPAHPPQEKPGSKTNADADGKVPDAQGASLPGGAAPAPDAQRAVPQNALGGAIQVHGNLQLNGGVNIMRMGNANVLQPGLVNFGAEMPALKTVRAEGFSNCLHMGNRDAFFGQLLSFTPESGIAWLYEEGASPFVFKCGKLDCIEFADTKRMGAGADDLLVTLRNGDSFTGTLTGRAGGKLTLKTAFAESLSIPDSAVESLSLIKNKPNGTLDMLGQVQDWTKNSANGNLQIDGQMTIPPGMRASREVAQPATCCLNADLAPRRAGEMRNLQIQLFSGQSKSGDLSYVLVNLRNDVLILSLTTESNGQGFISSSSDTLGAIPLPKDGQPLHLSFLVNTEAKTITPVINGKLTKLLRIGGKPPAGHSLVLTNVGSAPVSILRLDTTPWNGQAAAKDIADNAQTPETDALTLTNQDVVRGQITAIGNGKASIKTDFSTMDVPLDRVLGCRFAGTGKPDGQPLKNPVQFFFGQSANHLTLDLQTIKDGVARGVSSTLGPCTLNLGDIRKMTFNPDAGFRRTDQTAAGAKK